MLNRLCVVASVVMISMLAAAPAIAQPSASGRSSHKMHKMKMSTQDVMRRHHQRSMDHGAMGHRMRHGNTAHKPKSTRPEHGRNPSRH